MPPSTVVQPPSSITSKRTKRQTSKRSGSSTTSKKSQAKNRTHDHDHIIPTTEGITKPKRTNSKKELASWKKSLSEHFKDVDNFPLDVQEVPIVTDTPLVVMPNTMRVSTWSEPADPKIVEVKVEREYPKLAQEYQMYLNALAGVIEPFSVSDFAEASLEGVVDSAL